VSGFDANGHELTFFAERLLRRAGLGLYRALLTRSPRSHHHQAVLVAVERVEPVRHFTKVGTGHGTENLYGSVPVTLDGDEDQILMLRSVHLNPGDGDDRLAEVKRIHNGTKNGAPHERHAIIAGDFNSITTHRSAEDGEPQRDFSRMAPADRYGKGVWPATGHDGHTDPDTRALDYLIGSSWLDQHINDHCTTPTIVPGIDRGGELIIDRCLTFGSISTVPDSVWVDTPREKYSDHCAFGGQLVVQRQQEPR
jgi:endonuclease/exonuclease/phosphatase family metal-dependent hydrolase